jgi:hypothetical protein
MRYIFVFMVVISTNALAWDNSDIEKPYNRNDSNYKSSMGNEYQYDLSRPVDRIRYETDYEAQRRDSLDVRPSRQIDRDLGQTGGGIRRR